MKKRFMPVFIFILAMVFLTSNVYAGKKKSEKKYEKKINRLEQKLEKADKKILWLQEELAAAKQAYSDLQDSIVPDIKEPPVVECKPEPAGVIECNSCDFKNRTFTEHNFMDASLVSADFQEAVLTGSNFSGANLTGAKMGGANLEGAKFSEAIIADVAWVTVKEIFDINNPPSFKAEVELIAICPNGTSARDNGGTCVGNMTPLP